jgi:hypothetical protein
MDDFCPARKRDLLRGQFSNYGQPHVVRIVFEEKYDENGEMYLRYYEVKSEGVANPPYQPYQG